MEALRGVSQRYPAKDFDLEKLRIHIGQDIRLLKKMLQSGRAHYAGSRRQTPDAYKTVGASATERG